MRSVPAGSFQRLSGIEALWDAYRGVRASKRRSPAMARFDLDADRHLFDLHRDLVAARYATGPWRQRLVHDPKTRLIAAPSIRDRIVHRALIEAIGPVYERGFIDHSYAGISGRGTHRAVLRYLCWLRQYRYRLHLDIRRYFLSIHHPTLCELLFDRLRDPSTRALIRLLLASGRAVYDTRLAAQILELDANPLPRDRGLPLGSYLSQWCGNFYLDGLDHWIKRELKVPGCLRYMDDLVLFDNDRERLDADRDAIAMWLAAERQLELNPGKLRVQSNREPGVFLGYRVGRAGITPSKKLRRNFKKKLKERIDVLFDEDDQLAERDRHDGLVRSIRSYQGLLSF